MMKKENDKYKRLEEIDYARGLAMICIVFSHVCWQYNQFVFLLKLFHVPVFFFITGFLLNPQKHIRTVIKTYYCTYVKYGLIALTFFIVLYGPFQSTISTICSYSFSILSFNASFQGIGQFWFLLANMMLSVLLIALLHLPKYLPISISIVFLVINANIQTCK